MIVIAELAAFRPYSYTVRANRCRRKSIKIRRECRTLHYAERYDQLGIAITVRVEVGSTRVWITVESTWKSISFVRGHSTGD